MPYNIAYEDKVWERDFPSLPKANAMQILKAVKDRLAVAPSDYGKPLANSLAGLWSLRIGDWRVIYKVEGVNVLIFAIGHRRDVYDIVRRRIGKF